MREGDLHTGAHAFLRSEHDRKPHTGAHARNQIETHARSRAMSAPYCAGESTVENTGNIFGRNAASIIFDLEHG